MKSAIHLVNWAAMAGRLLAEQSLLRRYKMRVVANIFNQHRVAVRNRIRYFLGSILAEFDREQRRNRERVLDEYFTACFDLDEMD